MQRIIGLIELSAMTNGRSWALLRGSIGWILLALAGVGQAQQRLGDPGEGIKPALLILPAVQKELKVTAKQATEVARPRQIGSGFLDFSIFHHFV